jgi:hypothetical protein
LQTEPGGKRGLYRAKFDAGAPWDCPRFPQQRYGPIGVAALDASVRMACSTASVGSRDGRFGTSLSCAMLGTKYTEVFARKWRQSCLQPCSHLRRQLRRSLYLNLNLDLRLVLYPSLFGGLFE